MDSECKDCGKEMTLLLFTYKCDWCAGDVVIEWEDSPDTEPYGSFALPDDDHWWPNMFASSVHTLESEDFSSWCSMDPPEPNGSGSLDDWFDYYNLPCTD